MMKPCANDDLDVSMPVFCHSLPFTTNTTYNTTKSQPS